jgi:hypothetical protein
MMNASSSPQQPEVKSPKSRSVPIMLLPKRYSCHLPFIQFPAAILFLEELNNPLFYTWIE